MQNNFKFENIVFVFSGKFICNTVNFNGFNGSMN